MPTYAKPLTDRKNLSLILNTSTRRTMQSRDGTIKVTGRNSLTGQRRKFNQLQPVKILGSLDALYYIQVQS